MHRSGVVVADGWQEPRRGLRRLLREVFLRQTDLWA